MTLEGCAIQVHAQKAQGTPDVRFRRSLLRESALAANIINVMHSPRPPRVFGSALLGFLIGDVGDLQTDTILDQIWPQLGFAETDQKRYFCCKVLDERYNWLSDPSRWSISMADSEIY